MKAEVSRVVRDLERLVQPRQIGEGGALQTAHTSAADRDHPAVHRAGDAGEPRVHGSGALVADLDAIPDGDTGEPESGYLVGIETPTDPTLLEPLPPKPRTPGHADGGTRSKGKASND